MIAVADGVGVSVGGVPVLVGVRVGPPGVIVGVIVGVLVIVRVDVLVGVLVGVPHRVA